MSPTRFSRLGAFGLLGLGVAFSFVIGSWPGCTIYDSSLLAPADGGPLGETGPTQGGSCAHVRWPDRPATDDSSLVSNFEMVGAIQALDIGVGPDAGLEGGLPPIGWDLDNGCTCYGDPPSCKQAANTAEVCDDDAGRDHIALQFFRDLGPIAQSGSAQANKDIHAGNYGLLIKVTNYNAQRNDRQVSVAVYASNGVVGIQDGGSTDLSHDGGDRWTVDPKYLVNGGNLPAGTDCDVDNTACEPVFVDNNAYVAGYTLVSKSLPTLDLTFGSRAYIGGALMRLSAPVVVAHVDLAEAGTDWKLTNGSISGRWQTSQLLSNMATIPDNLVDGSFFCGSDPFYPTLKATICALQDIASATGSDNNTPSAPCNALSMAFGFEAEPARLGLVYAVPPAPAGCKSDSGLPWQDDCPPP